MFYEKRSRAIPYFSFSELEEIPGLVHAFTSRHTDEALEDERGLLSEAGQRSFSEALALDRRDLVFLKQVHGDRLVVIEDGPDGSGPFQADALLIERPGLFGVIRTADCVPLLLVSKEGQALCLVHAGWRGTCAGIAQKAARVLLERCSAEAGHLVAAIGPSIRRCCYQVGSNVVESYRHSGHPVREWIVSGHLDLVEATRRQLQAAGVTSILDSGHCTCCQKSLYYSYRRSADSDRMWLLAGFRP